MKSHLYDNNFTVYKVYPNKSTGLARKDQRQAVIDWVSNLTIDWFRHLRPKIRYDKTNDCFRVMVNEARVRDTGYTQLLWFKDAPKNVGHIYLPPPKETV